MEFIWMVWLLCAFVGYAIGKDKTNIGGGLGFVLGLFLGLIGIVIILLVGKNEVK
jgi:hypothetical protein